MGFLYDAWEEAFPDTGGGDSVWRSGRNDALARMP
jgi:hypothetical protein